MTSIDDDMSSYLNQQNVKVFTGLGKTVQLIPLVFKVTNVCDLMTNLLIWSCLKSKIKLKRPLITVVDLNEYLDFHFGDCEYIRQRSSIVLQQLQLELAVLADLFLYSYDAQWSYRIEFAIYREIRLKPTQLLTFL